MPLAKQSMVNYSRLAMKIEILCTGDEILTGKTINTNHAYIAQRLVEKGFDVRWATMVGDDRHDLTAAFADAASRADVVIVNGGLGPTVDDLSQEVAASAAGVPLVLNESWLEHMQAWYASRGRVMPGNNRKQAMLPQGAEFIDNPYGTACGFAIDIERARFFFTPGVPREMKPMLNEQVIPRLDTIRGFRQITRVKRFHSFGIGESRSDMLLDGVEDMVHDGSVKLGFQSHYPQLETKLTATGTDREQLDSLIEPLARSVRQRLGNFVLCEDDQTVEGEIISALKKINSSLSVIEMHTAGGITARLMRGEAEHGDNETVLKRGTVCADPHELGKLFEGHTAPVDLSSERAVSLAELLLTHSDASHSLVVLTAMQYDRQNKQRSGNSSESVMNIWIGMAGPGNIAHREARLPGSIEWTRSGATELGIDCFRRFLLGLPVAERIDFEQHQ